jgi:DNA-binding LacI/PurR family transcriptional regulator
MLGRIFAVEYLLSLGRGHIGYVGEATSESICYAPQAEIFLREAEAGGVTVSSHEIGRVAEIEKRLSHLPTAAAEALRDYLLGLPKPAAVHCEDDFVARVTCDEPLRAGIAIPEEHIRTPGR